MVVAVAVAVAVGGDGGGGAGGAMTVLSTVRPYPEQSGWEREPGAQRPDTISACVGESKVVVDSDTVGVAFRFVGVCGAGRGVCRCFWRT